MIITSIYIIILKFIIISIGQAKKYVFVACGIWCLADVSSVSPSSEQTESAPMKG